MPFLDIQDPRYPKALKEIAKPPKRLYYRGNIDLLKEERILAVVGTRAATRYGRELCEELVTCLVSAGVCTVSGLALGIDAVCHRKTLALGGKTIAVLACGLDYVYPKSNDRIWREIEEKGLLLSEYPEGTKPLPHHFPERNRIIAGLVPGVVVVESKERGGSLITAELALEENRDVYAIPGDLNRLASCGCNALIRDSKAKLLAKMDEILYDYQWNRKENKKSSSRKTETMDQIYQAWEGEISLEALEERTGFSRRRLLVDLMKLEIEGLVKASPGGKFKKIK